LFRRALAEAVLVGGLCGAIGVHVLLRRLAFFAHAAFPGVVVASLLGVSLIGGGAAGSLTLVGVIAGVGSVRRLGHATATGIALAGAFATGVLMLTTQPGSSNDLAAFLVGSVLTTTPTDLVASVAAGSGLLGRPLLCPQGAGADGVRPAGGRGDGWVTRWALSAWWCWPPWPSRWPAP